MDKVFSVLDEHKWSMLTFMLAVIISVYFLLSRTYMNVDYFGMKCLGGLISIISIIIGVALSKTSLIIIGISIFIHEIIFIIVNKLILRIRENDYKRND